MAEVPADDTPAETPPTEGISDGDTVYRQLFAPYMGSFDAELHWHRIFLFKTDQGYKQSLVWGRYATVEDVHALGCVKQANDRARNRDTKYIGAVSALAEAVRGTRVNSVSAIVEHDPSDNQGRHHAVVRLVIADGVNPKSGECKNDRAAISSRLQDAFMTRHPHVCPEPEVEHLEQLA